MTFFEKNKSQLRRRKDSQFSGHGLCRILSKGGIASRSTASELILAGRVRVNGKTILDPERKTFENEKIEIDGQTIKNQKKIYLMMNKPLGVITTFKDPENRPTVYEYLPVLDSWIFPVGRLDAKTTGLLIFTNDTALGERLTNHEYGIEKTYEVKIRGSLDEASLDKIRKGVILDDGYKTLPCQCTLMGQNKTSTWFKIILKEGKNRQIRRMFESVRKEVLKLCRIGIGSLVLGELKPGETRKLSAKEIEKLNRI